MLNYEQISNRLAASKSNKRLWESHLRECYDYALPERNTIDKLSPGQKKRRKIYDDTAVEALEDFANRMNAMLVPAGTQWMKLEAGSDIPVEQKDEADVYLEGSTDTLFTHIDSSNFQSQINEAFLDMGISTGCIMVEPGVCKYSTLEVALPVTFLRKTGN